MAKKLDLNLSVIELFEHQAQKTPQAIALCSTAATASYIELDAAANRVARALKSFGVAAGDGVGICLDRGISMIAAILGILKLGAFYVPMDVEYPDERIQYMAKNAAIKFIFVEANKSALFEQSGISCGALEKGIALAKLFSDQVNAPPLESIDRSRLLGSLIYVIYTSGSTGKPKGAGVYHKGFVNLISWYVSEFDMNETDTLFHMTSPAFDLTQKNIFAPLLVGGKLCLLEGNYYDANKIADHIECFGVTRLNCTPSAFSGLVHHADSSRFEQLKTLKTVFLGGEPIQVSRLLSWKNNPFCQAEVVNSYGPTECTDVCAYYRLGDFTHYLDVGVPIGRPVDHFELYVLDEHLKPVPDGQIGELCVGGLGVGAGYFGLPDLTREKFVDHPFDASGGKIYHTGDSVRWLSSGSLSYLGRIDQQVKIRGFRIELGEIERALENHADIAAAALAAFPDQTGENRLVSYLVAKDLSRPPSASVLRRFLQLSLPDFMLPTAWLFLPNLPMTANGKLDRKALPKPTFDRPNLDTTYIAPKTESENFLLLIWQGILALEKIGLNDRFFELGGTSVKAIELINQLQVRLKVKMPIVHFFRAPTLLGLSIYLWDHAREVMIGLFPEEYQTRAQQSEITKTARAPRINKEMGDIAIIGMAARLPGAENLDVFWENLKDGIESIRLANPEELVAAGVSLELSQHPDYVPAYASVDDVECFDAHFFGVTPRDAEVMDPQHRLFLEVAWSALDNAGYSKEEKRSACDIGIYGGIARDAYLTHFVARHPQYANQLGEYIVQMGNDKSFPATRVAYKLNLTGPAMNVQTACSSSGVALHLACMALKSGDCDIALVGGGRVLVPTKMGYRYVDGGTLSKDGHIRTFDDQASGMVRGSGMAFIVLKPLEQALKDKDPIRAVIKGIAINNDGADKPGYTAPSVEGQRKAIVSALLAANMSAEEIDYVEAHGTGTQLGDPIELSALTAAFGESTEKKQFCRIGSVKSNIGHLDAGAAVVGVIKTVLALEHELIPPTLNYTQPNRHIDFEETPFEVNATLSPWCKQPQKKRSAGVSSFGLGGTNAHIILQEFSDRTADSCEKELMSTMPWAIVPVSAKSDTALRKNVHYLSTYLQNRLDIDPLQMAIAIQEGRAEMEYREALIISAHQHIAPRKIVWAQNKPESYQFRKVKPDYKQVWMFPGQGAQYAGMARSLYAGNHIFKQAIDACCEYFREHLEQDLRPLIFGVGKELEANEALKQTQYTQPALFTIEYALAQLLLACSFRPDAMLGHSIGDYVAATVSGVMSLEDATFLVAKRAACMQAMQPGGMIAVRASVQIVQSLLPSHLSIAAENSTDLTVVAGESDAIAAWIPIIEKAGLKAQLLKTSHAFHSSMMKEASARFAQEFSGVTLRAPSLRFVSSLTGDWITPNEATSPEFWARQILMPVKFNTGLKAILSEMDSQTAFLEVGPGNALATFAKSAITHRNDQNTDKYRRAPQVLGVLPHAKSSKCSTLAFLEVLGQLWCQGCHVDWRALNEDGDLARIPLPPYQFDRKRYWLDLPEPKQSFETQETRAEIDPMLVDSLSPSSLCADEIPSSKGSRVELLKQHIRQLLGNLSGIEVLPESDDVHFLEMGLDSLFLTQLASELKAKFSVDIRFRELMESLSTVVALAENLDQSLPPDTFQPQVSQAQKGQQAITPLSHSIGTPLHAAVPFTNALGGAEGTLIAQVIQAQMQIMLQQLTLLQGGQPTLLQEQAVLMGSPSVTPSVSAAKEAPLKAQLASKAFGAQVKISKAKLALTGEQQRYIQDFTTHYVKKTHRSKEYTTKYRKILADPRVVSGFTPQLKELVYPIVVERSLGAEVWDIDGNAYIDMVNGFGSTFLGHNPSYIREAIEKQLQAGVEIGPQSPLAGEVAELFCELTGNERVVFCNTGSEAVLGALRLARTVTGRKKVVMFNDAYHGINDEVIVRAGVGHKSVPAAAGIPPQAVDNILVLEYGAPSSLETIRTVISELAAVIVEPVQSRNLSLQPVVFLKELREITEKAGVAFIMDEVITGFRAHIGGAQAYFGIKADIATYGKVLGGGMPIGAIGGRSKFMDALDGGFWQFGDQSEPEAGVTYFAGTFVRHPLTMAAARATLVHLKAQGNDLQQRVNEATARWVGAISQVIQKHRLNITISYFSSAFRLNFPQEFQFQGVFYAMLRQQGIHIAEGRTWFITSAHTDQHLSHLLGAVERALQSLMNAGLLLLPDQHAAQTERSVLQPEKAIISSQLQQSFHYELGMSESQREIWGSAQFGSDASCAFNESVTLFFEGHIHEEAFAEAVSDLTRRHHILTARFDASGEKIIFNSSFDLPYEKIDFSHLESTTRQEAFRQLCRKSVETAFDFVSGPLGYILLVKLQEREYRCVIALHHIVMDGWSMSVLVRELGDLYTARLNKVAHILPEPPQFRDYLSWQESAGDDHQKCEKYWLDLFAGELTMLNLPTDRPHAIERSFKGMRVDHLLKPELVVQLKKLAISEKTTLVTLLYSAFVAFVRQLTEQDDLVIGILSAGHLAADMPRLIGHCVNVLPVRNTVSATQPFSSFLAQTKKVLYGVYDHQNYTYGSLISRLKIKRQPGRIPLMPILFNVDQASDEPYRYQGAEVGFQANPRSFESFEMSLNVTVSTKAVMFQCSFNTDLFDAQTIEMRLAQFETLLASIVFDVNQPIEKLNLLSKKDQEFLISGVNHSQCNYGEFVPFISKISQAAKEYEQKIAVKSHNNTLTFGALNTSMHRLAVQLSSLHLRPQQKVGVMIGRSIEMLISVLAILKVGACYVPLDPEYPEDRLRYMVEDAHLSLLVVDKAHKNKVQALAAGVSLNIFVVDEAQWNSAQNDQPITYAIQPSDAAYMIYTSGSTGKPKGVVIPHIAVTNFLLSMQSEPGVHAEDKILAVTTLSFDIAVLELYLPLMCGAEVVIASRDLMRDAQALSRYIEAESITLLQATPTTWRSILQAGWRGSKNLKALCGGEVLDDVLASQMLSHCQSVWNMYGPTETTVWSTCYQVRTPQESKRIGRPIANTQVYVLNKHRLPVPIGVPGELYIGGHGLALGYHERDLLTHERFVTVSLYGHVMRLYRTGDRVVLLRDGTLVYMNRIDQQVKLRGFRIELGEIEETLLAHDAIKNAVVIVREVEQGDFRLVAYFVKKDASWVSETDLRKFVGAQLPRHMVPQHFVEIKAIPLTPNQKVDRKTLQHYSLTPQQDQELPVLKTESEKYLAAIWCDVVGVSVVQPFDNFFDVGGHSLLFMKVISRVEQETGIRLSPNELILYTLEQIAGQHIFKADSTSGETVSPEALSHNVGEPDTVTASPAVKKEDEGLVSVGQSVLSATKGFLGRIKDKLKDV